MIWLLGLDWTPYRPLEADAEPMSELAGRVRPAITPYAGLQGDQNTWILGLGYARQVDVRWTGEDRVRQSQSGLRVSLDWQTELPVASPFVLWAGAGVSAVAPWATETDSAATAEEQASLDEASLARMGRIGSVGGRVGVGVDWPLNPSFSLGGRVALAGLVVQDSDSTALNRSAIVGLETGLRAQVSF